VTYHFDIAIIGGGYAGTVLALHLCRCGPSFQIAVIEPRSELGSGLAYSTPSDLHKINVPAHTMGVSDARDDRFMFWLETEHPELLAGPDDHRRTYVARRWFGVFVRDRLRRDLAEHGSQLRHYRTTAADLRKVCYGSEIILGDGTAIFARRTVIAASHGVPAIPRGIPSEVQTAPNFLGDPWDLARIAAIPPDDDVLIVGTALTMADVAVSLLAQNHNGRIVALSRHGMLSRANGPSDPPSDLDFSAWPPDTARGLVRRIRQEIRRNEASGGSWRDIFSALRQQNGHLWRKLPLVEKRRFLRHLKCFYDVHRYRMAPDIAERIDVARRAGQIQILAARLLGARRTGRGFSVEIEERCRATERAALAVSTIINCTGPQPRLDSDPAHFFGALMARGVVQRDVLGLGLVVDDHYRLTGGGGDLYALGPLTRAHFGDTIGAPEITQHAQILASIIARSLSHEGTDAIVPAVELQI
jgi:uncharacterized NAD(P)/FAD-binding protein YdhS